MAKELYNAPWTPTSKAEAEKELAKNNASSSTNNLPVANPVSERQLTKSSQSQRDILQRH